MNFRKLKTTKAVVICLIQLICFSSFGQNNSKSDVSLYDEIVTMDSLLFTAFNNSDFDTYSSLISDNIEFYHDKNGLNNSKEEILKSFQQMTSSDYSIKRELLESTIEVHKIANSSALQSGTHRFIETYQNGQTTITKARFIHLWVKNNNSWKIGRVFSFDHQPIKEKINPDEPKVDLSIEEMEIYTGDFQFSPDFIISIRREGGKLFGLAQGDKIEIIPYNTHQFLISRDNSKLNFLVDDKGNVNGMEIISGQERMEGQKQNIN